MGVKIHKGKIKYIRDIDTTDKKQIDGTEMEKVTNYTIQNKLRTNCSQTCQSFELNDLKF